MIDVKHPKDLARLRRIALEAQGLLTVQPFGRGLVGARDAVAHLGYVQIDSISVVERAHHHVLYTRVPQFTPAMTNQLLLNRDIFEYWSHAAAFLPIEDFRFSLPYKHAIKMGQTHWFKTPDKKLMRRLLDRVRAEGPLRARDLESGAVQRQGWWDWKPAKQALEQLYMQGDLMVSDRAGFQKTYDLTERVLPAGVSVSMPTVNEFASHLIDQQLRCHGVASLKGFTYLRRSEGLREAVKVLVAERLELGTLAQLRMPSGEVFVVDAGALQRRLPRVSNRMTILSPFDNSVIQRDRLKTLFQYDYQIECYVPEAKRRYGYFCLPLLYRDRFVGHVDCKAHRKSRRLEIKSLQLGEGGFNLEELVVAFAKAIASFSVFQGCDAVSLTRVYPKRLRLSLQRALVQVGG